jgi:hypothetical protein
MPTRRLALLGTERSPWVSYAGVKEPLVKVCGLPEGESLTVFCTNSKNPMMDPGEYHKIDSNGLHPISAGVWAQVNVGKRIRTLIVEIVSKAAA